jgi:uncharacterized membrane protein YedE/YeeE
MLGIAVCWAWVNILRESLADGISTTQFVAENWLFTLIATLGILLWTSATWERFRSIGAYKWMATACTAALAVLWGYLFYLQMRPLLAFGLLLVVPLPLALASEEINQGTDAPQNSPENP